MHCLWCKYPEAQKQSWLRSLLLGLATCGVTWPMHVQGLCQALESMPVPDATVQNGGHVPGEGADFVLTEVTDTLQKMKAEGSILKYLSALLELKYSPYLAATRKITRLRLQAELYSLTSSGSPRYLPRSVHQAAFKALDSLFPYGRRSRRIINVAFRFLHPSEWGWAVVDAYRSAVDAIKAWLCFWYNSTIRALSRLSLFRWRYRQYKRK